MEDVILWTVLAINSQYDFKSTKSPVFFSTNLWEHWSQFSSQNRLGLYSLVYLVLNAKKRTTFLLFFFINRWRNSLIMLYPSCHMTSKNVNMGTRRTHRVMAILLQASWYLTWSMNVPAPIYKDRSQLPPCWATIFLLKWRKWVCNMKRGNSN